MKVIDLITQLQLQDPEAPVLVYSDVDEGGGLLRKLDIEDKEDRDTWHYHKGAHPFSYDTSLKGRVVTLIG